MSGDPGDHGVFPGEEPAERGVGIGTAVWRRAVGSDAVHALSIAAGDGTVRPMEGLTLTALVEDARKVGRRYALPLVGLTEAFHRFASVLAHAHDRLILHGSISPDTLVFGRFGEAVITDWRTTPPAQPTPWMQPDRQAKERPGPEDDLYALCACLWYAVHLEAPSGDLVPSSDLPSPLRDLLAQALSRDRTRRFREAGRLAEAVRGLAPAEYRFADDGSLQPRPPRRSSALWLPVGALAAAAAVWLLVAQPMQATARPASAPPPPWLHETFADAGWSGRWRARGEAGQFSVQGGALTNHSTAAILVLDRILNPPATLEFVAEIPLGSSPGDLSAVWGEGSLLDPLWTFPYNARLPDNGRYVLFQNGAYDNTFNCVQVADGGLATVSYQEAPLEHGRQYRIRVEVQPRRVAMWRDGLLVGSHDFDIAMRPGTFALYLFHPGKLVREVKVWRSDPLPDPLAVGDACLAVGATRAAVDAFSGLVQSAADPATVDLARYHLGIALHAAADPEAAVAAWADLRDPILVARSRLQGLDAKAAAGRHDEVLAALAQTHSEVPELRRLVAVRLSALFEKVTWSPRFEDYVALRERLMPDDDVTGVSAARYLGWRHRYERIVERYGRYRMFYIDALFALGDFGRIERDGGDQPRTVAKLQMQRGRFQQVVGPFAEAAEAMCLDGRIDEAIARDPADPRPLLYAGRYAEAARCASPRGLIELARRWEAGSRLPEVAPGANAARLDERLKSELPGPADGWVEPKRTAETLLLAEIESRPAEVRNALRALLASGRMRQDDALTWFHQAVLPAYLEELAGGAARLKASLPEYAASRRDRFGQRLWYFSQRLSGAIDEAAFLAQPARVEAPAWLALADAMAADLRGDRVAARTHWSALAAMPPHLRCFGSIEGSRAIDLLIAWRARMTAP